MTLPPWPRNTALECFLARGLWALSGHSLTVLSWLPLAITHVPPTRAGLTDYIIVPGRKDDSLWTELVNVEPVSDQQVLRCLEATSMQELVANAHYCMY